MRSCVVGIERLRIVDVLDEGVGLEELAASGIVVPGAEVIEPRLHIEFPARRDSARNARFGSGKFPPGRIV